MYTLPTLKTDNENLNLVYRIAIGDIYSNITTFKDGLLKEEAPVLLAGIGYNTPWTRDAAINIWNGCGLLVPEVSKNTLLSTIIDDNGRKRIGGEYWDAIIWAIGAEWYYKYTGDEDFLPLMTEVIENSLAYFENTEFDEELNLFRGPACYGDGISAYPDWYKTEDSGIKNLLKYKPEMKAEKGEGIPMHTLSTNCLYYKAYIIAYNLTNKKTYQEKAGQLKDAINTHFWNDKKGLYNYIVDIWGGSDYSEGMGQSFAILFGIADEKQKQCIIKNQKISGQGIPCIDKKFPRYEGYGLPRHAEIVWPQIQAFWADAVAKDDVQKFEHEFMTLTNNVKRDGYFSEVYHPETGNRYGGIQEWQGEMVTWKSEIRQTWAATGYIRMVLFDLFGMRFKKEGLYIKPLKTSIAKTMQLKGLQYRNATVDIYVTGDNYDKEVFVPANYQGKIEFSI